jgi:hypothetical protein
VLDIDPTRIGAGEISQEFFVRGRVRERITRQQCEEGLEARSKACLGGAPSVLLGVPSVD